MIIKYLLFLTHLNGHVLGGSAKTRVNYDRRGPFEYTDGALSRVLFPGGYISNGVAYNYVTDWQGNVRQVIDGSTGEPVQETHYYPYGMPFAESAVSELKYIKTSCPNPYRFGGKEWVTAHGADLYDFGARGYNYAIGGWDRIDPLCEKFYQLNPYSYCGGDPVNIIDPDGRKLVFVHGYLGFGSPKGGAVYWNGCNSSFVRGVQSTFKDFATPFFTNYDYTFSQALKSNTESLGYEYAKANYQDLTKGMILGKDKFNFVSHSMGGSFSEGMIRYLSEQGWETNVALFLNAWKPTNIKTKKENIRIDATCANDPVQCLGNSILEGEDDTTSTPVQRLSTSLLGNSNIPHSDLKIRTKSGASFLKIHRDLNDINSAELWKLIKDFLSE